MKSQTPINVRIPQDLKQEASAILNDMGLSPSSAVRLFLSQVVKQKRIPFPIVGKCESYAGDTSIEAKS